jgi:hypothetical protein
VTGAVLRRAELMTLYWDSVSQIAGTPAADMSF